MKKSHPIKPLAWAVRNSAQVGPDLRGEGSMLWRLKIAQTLDGVRKENIELRTDREILRKAAAYFARETMR